MFRNLLIEVSLVNGPHEIANSNVRNCENRFVFIILIELEQFNGKLNGNDGNKRYLSLSNFKATNSMDYIHSLYLPIIIQVLQELDRSIDCKHIFRFVFFHNIKTKFVVRISAVKRFHSIIMVFHLPINYKERKKVLVRKSHKVYTQSNEMNESITSPARLNRIKCTVKQRRIERMCFMLKYILN